LLGGWLERDIGHLDKHLPGGEAVGKVRGVLVGVEAGVELCRSGGLGGAESRELTFSSLLRYAYAALVWAGKDCE
jgi:hypothetical protein